MRAGLFMMDLRKGQAILGPAVLAIKGIIVGKAHETASQTQTRRRRRSREVPAMRSQPLIADGSGTVSMRNTSVLSKVSVTISEPGPIAHTPMGVVVWPVVVQATVGSNV